MKLQNKHWGSTIGIILGVLFFISLFGNPTLNGSNTFFTGILIIVGSLAYRSRKKQILSSKSKKIPILEIITLILLFLHISLGINQELWYDHPLNFTLVPIWILVVYISLFIIKRKK